jgi:hypothetical protein
LRKAAMRRLAERGANSKQIQSVSGHKTLKEVERYTAAASQARLAQSAIDLLGMKNEHRLSNRCKVRHLPLAST